MHWDQCLRVVAILALGNALSTGAVFLLEGRARCTFTARDLIYVIAIAPLELFFYRPVIMFARLKGTVDFALGKRSWNKFERNDRGRLAGRVDTPSVLQS